MATLTLRCDKALVPRQALILELAPRFRILFFESNRVANPNS